MTRRRLLHTMGTGFGSAALAHVLQANTVNSANPLAPRAPHFAPKAKHVIFLFLNGGPSQVDTFDPKPMLTKFNGQPMPAGNLEDGAQDRQLAQVSLHVQEVRPERNRI